MAAETIKARVIQTARQDPFLSIEEIARSVDTTPRYVRTILSESQVSLMQLRKSYAKTMEKKLQPQNSARTSVKELSPNLQLHTIRDQGMAALLAADPDTELKQASKLETINGIPAFVQLTTYAELKLGSMNTPLRHMLSIDDGPPQVTQKEHWVEVVTDHPTVSKIISPHAEQPVLKLTFLLYHHDSPIAIETQWLPTEGILLRGRSGSMEISAEPGV